MMVTQVQQLLTPASLLELRRDIDDCSLCAARAEIGEARLNHIWGAGKSYQPDIMFVLMNPTARNLTAHSDSDLRVPYAGVSQFWKVLAHAGLISPSVLEQLRVKGWHDDLTRLLINTLEEEGYYLTNLVKCTSPKAQDPGPASIRRGLQLLHREIEIVQPKHLVAFGLLTFRALTGQSLKLQDFLARLEHGISHPFTGPAISGHSYPVWPCYFPTGRGNSQAAIKCLQIYNQTLRSKRNVS